MQCLRKWPRLHTAPGAQPTHISLSMSRNAMVLSPTSAWSCDSAYASVASVYRLRMAKGSEDDKDSESGARADEQACMRQQGNKGQR